MGEIRDVIRHHRPSAKNRELRHSMRRRLTPWWPHQKHTNQGESEIHIPPSSPIVSVKSEVSLSPTSMAIHETEKEQGILVVTNRGSSQYMSGLVLENISEPE